MTACWQVVDFSYACCTAVRGDHFLFFLGASNPFAESISVSFIGGLVSLFKMFLVVLSAHKFNHACFHSSCGFNSEVLYGIWTRELVFDMA